MRVCERSVSSRSRRTSRSRIEVADECSVPRLPSRREEGSVKIPLTVWPHYREPQGRRISTTWNALAAKLEVARETNDKLTLACFTVGTFVDDRRALANVERIHALG